MLFEINHLKLVLIIIIFKSIEAAPYLYCLLLKSADVIRLKAAAVPEQVELHLRSPWLYAPAQPWVLLTIPELFPPSAAL